ncbi:PhzF family phenazine biosynthesis protein [Haloprofundus halophilus]|uniref:PhzF family phenazine biosynthesis protein n=1 Tax=Haloprofundus halophilus TaxID=2283527 RepID=UPI000E42E1BF|nr:PhzF family phenazine biosynthesis protein [Haloprofundus halophilus]
MDTRRALLVDAFTTEPLAGNAAGVVPDADGLSVEQMQAVARELSVSETAFLRPSESADRRVRYFTPTQEVDLCGHATVAAHAHLSEEGVLDAGVHTLETNVGDLEIELTDDGVVWMTQSRPTVRPVDVDYERASEALGVPVESFRAVADELPAAVASTGLPFLVLGVDFLDAVGGATPDMGAVAALADEHDATGVYLFCFDTLDAESTLHARMFAPGAGVPEDPVTGTASGACGAYLEHVGAFDTLPDEMQFEQGEFVDRPGRVRVRVGDEVRVGGRAVTAFDGTLVVPEIDTDEILEA